MHVIQNGEPLEEMDCYNTSTGGCDNWQYPKFTYWRADNKMCFIYSKIHQKSSNSPIEILFIQYIHRQLWVYHPTTVCEYIG